MTITLQKLREQLKKIKTMGFVKTHRAHDTGIGKTLEDLLGIKENNLRLPDVGDVELKAKRIDSGSMLTVATKSPEPKGINKILFEKYKYLDKEGKYNLHSTVYGSRKNPQSFKIVFEGEKLVLKNKSKIAAYWPIAIFDDVLKAKSDKILVVFAETKGERKTKNEKFHFTKAYLLSNLNINKFKSAVESGKLKIDIRIGIYRSGKNKGKYHDHGTGFRINKRDFLHLFDNFTQII
ncbi:glycosyl hydrolase [bacterium]|nr:MAG: glycosyl hydrolase [bacterium]